jgi:ferric-chelate reductase
MLAIVNGTTSDISIQIASDPISIGYHLDVVVLAIFGVFSLANVRRAFASVFQASEPGQMYPLHYVKLQLSRSASEALQRTLSRSASRRAHAANVRPAEDDERRDELMNADSDKSNSYPKHVPACPPFMRFLARPLQYRIDPGVSLGHLVLLGGYFAIVAYGCFHLSDPVRDPDRTGHISVSQIPVLVAFATKNSIPGWMLGIGYEKVGYP